MSKPLPRDPVYKALPEEFLECLLSRRHTFPDTRDQQRQFVRIQYGPSRSDVLDITEYRATCVKCGVTRVLSRDRYSHHYLSAVYDHPEGYLAPPGVKWDRDVLWGEYETRYPIPSKVETRDRRGSK